MHGDKELINEAERLGYAGIALTSYFEDYNNDFFNEFEEIEQSTNLILKKCIEISCKNPEELKKKVQKSRKKVDIVMVRGGDLKVNRAACEDRRVDVLSQPYRSRRDTGLNHVLARKAAENNVAIEINLKFFLKTNLRYRYQVISQYRHIMDLQRKFEFPIIITSNSNSKYDLRTPQDIIALSKCFGMTIEESYGAISTTPENIIEINDNRSIFVIDGVKTI